MRVLAPKRALQHTFWLKRGHLSAHFDSQEGTLAYILAPKRALKRTFWLSRGHFKTHFGSQKGT